MRIHGILLKYSRTYLEFMILTVPEHSVSPGIMAELIETSVTTMHGIN